MKAIKRLLMIVGLAATLALSTGIASADNPHAGNSGHFKGSSNPCQQDSGNPNCPPFG